MFNYEENLQVLQNNKKTYTCLNFNNFMKKMSICKNNEIYNSFQEILNDGSFKITPFGIKPVELSSKLNSSSIKTDIALKMVNIFNAYYNTWYTIEDLFNIHMLKDYIEMKNKIDYEYWKDSKSWIVGWFLNLITGIFEAITKLLKKSYDNFGGQDEEDNYKRILIVWVIIFIVIYLVYFYYNK